MAVRGTPARRVPGNPLAGMVRDLNRRGRRMRPRPAPPDEPAPAGQDEAPHEPPAPPAPAAAASPVLFVTTVTTGEDGRAAWRYPRPYAAAPVLTALAVDPAPDADDRTAVVALEAVTREHAVVRVWRTRPRRGQGVVEPAGPGVHVHLTAASGPPPLGW